MKDFNSSGLFSNWRSGTLTRMLFVLLLVAAATLLANFLYLSNKAAHDKEYLAHASELRVLSQQMTIQADAAVAGNSQGFTGLRAARDSFEQHWGYIEQGGSPTGLPAVSGQLSDELDAVSQDWMRVRRYAAVILDNQAGVQNAREETSALVRVREAAAALQNLTPGLLEKTTQLALGFAEGAKGRVWNVIAGYLLVAVILGSIILIALVNMRATRASLQETADKNERNQAAILRLLDEIGDLADGDLTIQATVTEDFTGAIADSINFTIDQLRELVGTINTSAVQVSSAAEDTQTTASKLAEASEHQAQEIAGASAAINEMAVSIDQVSANASESTAVAERSVAIANKGSEVVHNTISGMDRIREQIQDTSKRIKRLGESSQEIGDIVSLINDIADQTNILALNAAIQASMAGDAGRGFAVVADEVQRLAERSSAATKQIEALVKTIQTDTNEAVISMEQTTTEVVRGANLAQDAGVSLEEIENVSRSLASLIQNISNAARQQASSAGHISNTMNVIQEITSQTSSGTMATAQSIGHLARLASEMRDSVSGFRLPGQH